MEYIYIYLFNIYLYIFYSLIYSFIWNIYIYNISLYILCVCIMIPNISPPWAWSFFGRGQSREQKRCHTGGVQGTMSGECPLENLGESWESWGKLSPSPSWPWKKYHQFRHTSNLLQDIPWRWFIAVVL